MEGSGVESSGMMSIIRLENMVEVRRVAQKLTDLGRKETMRGGVACDCTASFCPSSKLGRDEGSGRSHQHPTALQEIRRVIRVLHRETRHINTVIGCGVRAVRPPTRVGIKGKHLSITARGKHQYGRSAMEKNLV
jgi:hypothetical protein